MTERDVQERYLTEWRSGVSGQIQDLQVQIRTIGGTMVTRADVAAMVAEQLPKETYQAAHTALTERISRIEASPQRLLGWLSLGIGCASLLIAGFVGLLSAAVTTILFVITHH